MKHLQVVMQVSDLAAKQFDDLTEAAKTMPPEDVAKAAGEAMACWLISYLGQPEKFEKLNNAFITQMEETAALLRHGILENIIADAGGRN